MHGFTPADRREISEISKSLSALIARYDLHAQLVEMNASLKALLQVGGMTPEEVGEATRQMKAIAADLREAAKDPAT